MARIRSIKPEFWTSEQVMECSTTARLMFIGLWNFADDCGRLPLSLKTIKAQIFPSDDLASDSIRGMINELSESGLLLIYTADGKEFLQITGWQHQRIDKPQAPKYPAPFFEDSGNAPVPFPPDRKGEDKKGKDSIPAEVAPEPKPEKKSRRKPQTAIADNFSINSTVKAAAVRLGFTESEIQREVQRFIRHAKQNDRRCADWQMAAQNWFDKAAEFAGKAPPVDPALTDDGLVDVTNDDQLAAWDRYAMDKGARSFPRNGRGGWRFPTPWPPGYTAPIIEFDAPPTPLRRME